MATKKYYAVRQGRKTGIFDTWAECLPQVAGYSGAVYKSFATLDEAEKFLTGEIAWGNKPAIKGAKHDKAPKKIPGRDNSVDKDNGEPVDYIIYTDGSCLSNPGGAGGWAVVRENAQTGEISEFSGGAKETTNNRMELTAALEALKAVAVGSKIRLYTDSQYLKNAFTKGWLTAWKSRQWKKADGTAVLNRDLWEEIDKAFAGRTVAFYWVKGHAGNVYNERCDVLAKEQANYYRSLA